MFHILLKYGWEKQYSDVWWYIIMIMLSIIVTVYNTEDYLSDCIESLLQQRNIDYEIILVDDGSTDTSQQICDHYSHCYDNIKVIHHKINRGLVECRNTGIQVSCGKYISFVDADDWVDDNYFSKYITKMEENSNISISITGTIKETCLGEQSYFYFPHKDMNLSSTRAFEEMLKRQIFGWELWGKIYRREVITTCIVDKQFSIGEDLERNFCLWMNVNTVWFSCERFYHYRFRINSMTNNVDTADKNLCNLFNKIYCSHMLTQEARLLVGYYLINEYAKQILVMFLIDCNKFYSDISMFYTKTIKLLYDFDTSYVKYSLINSMIHKSFHNWYIFLNKSICLLKKDLLHVIHIGNYKKIYLYYIDNTTKYLRILMKEMQLEYDGVIIKFFSDKFILSDNSKDVFNQKDICNNTLVLIPVTVKNAKAVGYILNKYLIIRFFKVKLSDFI